MGTTRAEIETKREKVKSYLASHGPATMADITKRTKVPSFVVQRMKAAGILEMEARPNGRGSGKVGASYFYSLVRSGPAPIKATIGEPVRVGSTNGKSLRERMSQTAKIAEASEILFGRGGPRDYTAFLHWVELTKEMM